VSVGGNNREGLIEGFLDGTLDRRQRRRLDTMLRDNPELARCVARQRALLDQMRRDGERAPDLTLTILDRVGHGRGFVRRSLLRVGTISRIAAALALLGAIVLIARVQRENPGVVMHAQAAPVTRVVDLVEREVDGRVRTLSDAAERVTGEIPRDVRVLMGHLTRSGPLGLDIDGTDVYLGRNTWAVSEGDRRLAGPSILHTSPFSPSPFSAAPMGVSQAYSSLVPRAMPTRSGNPLWAMATRRGASRLRTFELGTGAGVP